MLRNLLRRPGGHGARVLRRALPYWAAAAVPILAAVAVHDWAEGVALRRAREAEQAARLSLAERVVASDLSAARADLQLLGASGVVAAYVRDPDPPRDAALARDLFAFRASRPWARRVTIAIGGGASLVSERQSGPPACGASLGRAANLSSETALLDHAQPPADGAPLLCLALPLGAGAAGQRAAVVAEVEPRWLFADLLPDGGEPGPSLQDSQARWVLPPAGGEPARDGRAVALPSWSGSASGTWRIFLPTAAYELASGQVRRRSLALALLLLAASGAAALVLAHTAVARQEAESETQRQFALLELVSDNVPSPIVLKDVEGRYRACNVAFERLLGRPRQAILGRRAADLLPAEEACLHEEADRVIVRDGGTRQYEAHLRGGRGEALDVLVAKAAVCDEDGRVVGVTAALLDITARKAAEREVRRGLEALRQAKDAAEAGTHAKSEFLAMMSHEMRTPLHAVLGATGLLLDGPLRGEQREQAEIARAGGRALLELIDDLLDVSRIEAGRLDLERIVFDPRQLAEDTVALVAETARAKGLELSCSVAPDVPGRVSGDPGRLRQVLLNLLTNAVKFTERGEIGTALDLAARDVEGLTLRLRVRDTGPGIAPELVSRVFEPFMQGESSTRRRHGGAGLGLAIARRLVELMGGSIEVESTPGAGTEFICSVRLGAAPPIAEPAVAEGPAQAREQPGQERPTPARRRRVLLAEDNLVNQRVTCAQLVRLGCAVDLAKDGREAASAVERGRYDLVFMDCQMPGVDGYDATREIRRREADGPCVPIVALTANALRGDRERCLAAGMTDYLAKPTDLESLERVLERHAPSSSEGRPAKAAPEGGLALVDQQALSSLKALEKDGPGFLASLVRDFDESVHERLGDMQLAVRDNDGSALRGAAHSIKGSAGIVGAHSMANLCQRLEHLAAEGQAEAAEPLIAGLAHEHQAVMSVLREAAAAA